MKDNKIRSLIDAKRSGKRVAAIDFVADNPEIPAVLSKLVKSVTPVQYDSRGHREISNIDSTTMREASHDIGRRSKDADIVMELFPEMELSAQILISSVISPNDMNSTEVNFTLPPNLRVSPLTAVLMPIIKEHFEKSYKIEPLLQKILFDALFGSGSYPIAVIPESSIDDLINGSTPISTEALQEYATEEGTFRPIGILGLPEVEHKKDNFSLESLSEFGRKSVGDTYRNIQFKDPNKNNKLIKVPNVTVTDNFDSLKMPKIISRARKQAVDTIIGGHSTMAGSLESLRTGSFSERLNDQQLADLFYKSTSRTYKNIVKVKTDSETSRSSIGEPLILKLPSESVIPVYTPGNEEKHVGYFVLLDGEGNPVSKNSITQSDADLRSRLSMNEDMSSFLLNRAANNYKTDCNKVTFHQASRVYADIIESDLLARLRNGIVGSVVSVAKNEEVYRIMLARSLVKQNTQILYIPVELMTYFALRYNDFGVGISLLDKMRNLNSLRAMLLFAKTMAQIKNSIGRSKVMIKLDPTDPNPQKTIEVAMHEIARTRQQGLPLGINTAGDLVDWVQKAGLEYGFEGHPGLPDVGFEFSEHATNFAEPNNELSEDLRKSAIMATGLSPETVDNGFQADFATTVVANNLLLSKRVQKIQETFVPLVSDHCRKVALHDAGIFEIVKNTIKDNLSKITDSESVDPIITQYKDSNTDLLVHLLTLEFLSNFEFNLARPDNAVIKNLQEAFDIYEQMLDKALNFYISSDMLPASMVGDEANSRVEEIKQILKAHFLRQWMNSNNVLPELADLGAVDENGQPLLDFGKILNSHVNAMSKSIISLLQKTVPVGQSADKDIQRISGGEDLGENSVSPSSSNSDSNSGGDGLDGFGDDDDAFGGSFDGVTDDGKNINEDQDGGQGL